MEARALEAQKRITLIDAEVLIDIQRAYPPAVAWIQTAREESFSIPGLAAMELLACSRDQKDLEKANWYLNSIDVESVNEQDFTLALDFARLHSIRSGLSLADYFIAAQAINRSATLFSFNAKHFKVISGLNVVEPYAR